MAKIEITVSGSLVSSASYAEDLAGSAFIAAARNFDYDGEISPSAAAVFLNEFVFPRQISAWARAATRGTAIRETLETLPDVSLPSRAASLRGGRGLR